MPAVVAATEVVFQLAPKYLRDFHIFLEGTVATVSVTGRKGFWGDVFGNLGG